ncbi:MAG: EboA domain-containing protein [Bdellovibrionota bacterium]
MANINTDDFSKFLLKLLQNSLPTDKYSKLLDIIKTFQNSFNHMSFFRFYAGAGRIFGNTLVRCESNLAAECELSFDKAQFLSLWSNADMVRFVFLSLALERLNEKESINFVDDIYTKGDLKEQISLLRSLCFLPEAGRFVDTAIEALRSNSTIVFESIACFNEYPYRYFPLLHFNQMVLKIIYLGIDIDYIFGLRERGSSELIRALSDYVTERRSARRAVDLKVMNFLQYLEDNNLNTTGV